MSVAAIYSFRFYDANFKKKVNEWKPEMLRSNVRYYVSIFLEKLREMCKKKTGNIRTKVKSRRFRVTILAVENQ
jgi:hypothetical protein